MTECDHDPAAAGSAASAALPVLLTRDEVADLLQVSVRTVDRLIGRGALATCRIGRAVRVPLPALITYIEQNYE
jgi:excisionase family DNA binding protein